MKRYIQQIILGLAATLALASCSDKFDDIIRPIDYPTDIQLGMWRNTDNQTTNKAYTINLTLNEKGETVCDVTVYNPSTGKANVFSQGKVSYNAKSGMYTVNYDESMYDTPARITLAWRNNLQSMTVNIYTVTDVNGTDVLGAREYFNATPTDTISYLGRWVIDSDYILSVNPDLTCTLTQGNTILQGTVQKQGNGITASLDGGKVITLTTDSQGRTYAAINSTDAGMAIHSLTPLDDDWEVLGSGDYNSWLFGTLTGTLTYSEARQVAHITFIDLPDLTLSFEWAKGDAAVTFMETEFATGYVYGQYGEVYFYPEARSQPSAFDAATSTFTFSMGYSIPAYAQGPLFGTDDNSLYGNDTFTLEME